MNVGVFFEKSADAYHQKKEFLSRLVNDGHRVFLYALTRDYYPELEEIGCICIYSRFSPKTWSKNDIKKKDRRKIGAKYRSLFKMLNIDFIFTFGALFTRTVALEATISGIKVIPTIGENGEEASSLANHSKIYRKVYNAIFDKAPVVFFEDKFSCDLMANFGVIPQRKRIVLGAGINLKESVYEFYPELLEGNKIKILIVTVFESLCDAQGVIEETIKLKKVFGDFEVDILAKGVKKTSKKFIEKGEKKGVFKYVGSDFSNKEILKDYHGIIFTCSEYGSANLAMEAVAMGRPIIVSEYCQLGEFVEDKKSGYIYKPIYKKSFQKKLIAFLQKSYEEKKMMGIQGRKFAEEMLDRNLINNAYMYEMNRIIDIMLNQD
ncbi:Glycosyltransferase involved in cell wall bisynthesis [Lachnospiraceae bacterium C7]|nr:Glycosyltransferase involved in cell wall bisynthesis [Lachnospiraceae bacterium C7]